MPNFCNYLLKQAASPLLQKLFSSAVSSKLPAPTSGFALHSPGAKIDTLLSRLLAKLGLNSSPWLKDGVAVDRQLASPTDVYKSLWNKVNAHAKVQGSATPAFWTNNQTDYNKWRRVFAPGAKAPTSFPWSREDWNNEEWPRIAKMLGL